MFTNIYSIIRVLKNILQTHIKNILKKLFCSMPVNKWAIKLYSTVKPPPYLRDNMEFELDVWNGICSFKSADGRQIGENNTGPEPYRETIHTAHKQCHFEGSRQGMPINITALRNLMTVWDDNLQFVTMLRNKHIQDRGLSSKKFNLKQGYVFSKFAGAYVSYLARRADKPLETGSLTALQSAFFTLGVGPFMIVRDLMETGNLLALDEKPLSGEHLYVLADQNGTLVTDAGKGCAGSKKLIIDFVDVAMNGSYEKVLESPKALHGFSAIDDWDQFNKYLFASSRLELIIRLYQGLCMQNLILLRSINADFPSQHKKLIDKCLAESSCQFSNHDDSYGIASRFVEISLGLLEELNLPGLRDVLCQEGLDNQQAKPALSKDEYSITEVYRILTRFSILLTEQCNIEIKNISHSLGKESKSTISEDMFMERCCGTCFQELLKKLESAVKIR